MAIRFLWNNFFDTATVTASSAATDFPVSNIQHRWHTWHWRSTDVTSEWVKANLGAAKAVQALVIKYHNFQPTATVKIQANSSDSWTSPLVNVTLTVTSGQIVYYWGAAETYQWWRITIVDSGNPDGYVRMGRVFLGGYDTLSRRYSGYVETYADPSSIAYSTGGQIVVNEKDEYRIFSLSWPHITSADKTALDSIFATTGRKKPFFVTLDSGSVNATTFYVQNREDWAYQGLPGTTVYALTMTLEECR